MNNYSIFTGIGKQDIDKMCNCFHPVIKTFDKDDMVLMYHDKSEKMGVVLSGTIHLYCIDRDGEYSLLETCTGDDLIGEIFSHELGNLEYVLIAETQCEVMFFDYGSVIRCCENACLCHAALIQNLFGLVAEKSGKMMLHVNILSQRSVRRKLSVYLDYLRRSQNSDCVKVPMTLIDLADYLCIDRSAMMREIQKMKKDGLIDSKGRAFTIRGRT